MEQRTKIIFWMNDMGHPYPRMILHPIAPSPNAQTLNNPKYNCAKGTNFEMPTLKKVLNTFNHPKIKIEMKNRVVSISNIYCGRFNSLRNLIRKFLKAQGLIVYRNFLFTQPSIDLFKGLVFKG